MYKIALSVCCGAANKYKPNLIQANIKEKPMYNKMTENLSSLMQPLNDLVSINVKMAEKLINTQASFLTSTLNEGAEHTKALAGEKDLQKVLEKQKTYSKDLQEKASAAVKDVLQVATDSSKEVAEIVKSSYKAQAKKD